MAMRNFWLEANVEGRQTKIAGGPQRKDGSMTITLYMRNGGESENVIEIDCTPRGDTLNVTFEYAQEKGNYELVRIERER